MAATTQSSSAPAPATVNVSISCEPRQLSIAALKHDPDHVQLTISIHAFRTSTDDPVTIQVDNTIFEGQTSPDAPDQLHLGMVGGGLVCTNPPADQPNKRISLGQVYTHRAAQDGDDDDNLLSRPGARFETIATSTASSNPIATYCISTRRLFAFADGLTVDSLVPGEKYRISINPSWASSPWWCWGDLDRELKGKKLHRCEAGFRGEIMDRVTGKRRPTKEEIAAEGWVLGEDRDALAFVIAKGAGDCNVEIVA